MTRYTPLWLQAGNYPAAQDRHLISAIWPAARTSGLAVTAGTGTTVNIAPGSAAVPSQNNTGSTLCVSDAIETLTLPAAPGSGLERWDHIIIRPRGNDLDGGSNNDFIFDYVLGTAAAPPAGDAPAVAGTLSIASVHRSGGSANVVAGDIYPVQPGGLLLPPSPNQFGVQLTADVAIPANTNFVLPMATPYLDIGIWIIHVQVLLWSSSAAGEQMALMLAVGPPLQTDNTVLLGAGSSMGHFPQPSSIVNVTLTQMIKVIASGPLNFQVVANSTATAQHTSGPYGYGGATGAYGYRIA